MAATPRLHVAVPLLAGATVALPPAAARHVQVLRLQPGAALRLFDGSRDAEWPATVTRMTRAEVEVSVGEPVAVGRELAMEVTLALGAPANDRMDAFVEKACELGVAAIQPLLCERSVLRLAGDRAEAKQRHWSGIAASASEQCGRTRVARIAAMQPLATWLGALDSLDPHGEPPATRLLLGFDADAVPAAEALAAATATGVALSRIVVLSGPEGGLSGDEERLARGHGFHMVGLGPRVLRADTAPLALLAWLGLTTS